jgi:hypothetical protein
MTDDLRHLASAELVTAELVTVELDTAELHTAELVTAELDTPEGAAAAPLPGPVFLSGAETIAT